MKPLFSVSAALAVLALAAPGALGADVVARIEGPIVGGWHVIARPNASAELRPVVKAMLAKIPRKNPRLGKIESAQSQVVAGINYRLVVRLKDGTRWTATVWQKLDRSYQVSRAVRVR